MKVLVTILAFTQFLAILVVNDRRIELKYQIGTQTKEYAAKVEQQRLEIVKLKYDLKQMAKYAESRQALCTVKSRG